ncbi:MAG: methyltransferase domain-containing protein [Methanomassiliicoccales archaeon]|nr:methyltransferase domain-containing protein [Methanomassiliicoccales archaeon]
MEEDPFVRHAQDYDLWFERHNWAYRSELTALAQLVPQGRGLDIGVGSGRFAAPLGISIGLDPSLPMLMKARGRGVSVVRGRAESLPFQDGAFDLALLVTVLCFVDDPLAALKEARRVVRQDGRLIVGILDRESALGIEYQAKAGSSLFYRRARFLSALEILEMLERAGCRCERTLQTIFSDPSSLIAPDEVREGHGKGLFLAVSARI